LAEIALFCVQLALGIAIPWLIVRRDLASLDAERLDRAWNDASFWCAIVVFGPISLPFHFVKTRRSAFGVLLGITWMTLSIAAIGLVATTISKIVGLD
jgi:hypothetical protein